MPASQNVEEFLRSTASLPTEVTDEELEIPAPVAGMAPPLDPMKPWLSINVDSYMPIVKFAVKQPFKYAANKYDALWELEDDEVETISPALTEATQRCLYDLNLSSLAGNPYVAALVGLGGLAMAKYMSIKIVRALESAKAKELSEQGSGPRIRPQNPATPLSNQFNRSTSRPKVTGTKRVSSTMSTRTPASVDVSLSAGFRAPENPNSSSTEYDLEDE